MGSVSPQTNRDFLLDKLVRRVSLALITGTGGVCLSVRWFVCLVVRIKVCIQEFLK